MSQMPELIPEVDFWFGARDLDPIVKALRMRSCEESCEAQDG